jgi:hypothetical protein
MMTPEILFVFIEPDSIGTPPLPHRWHLFANFAKCGESPSVCKPHSGAPEIDVADVTVQRARPEAGQATAQRSAHA